MSYKKVVFICNIKNTFITNDIKLLEDMGYKVMLIYSPAYKDPFRFFFKSFSRVIFVSSFCAKGKCFI